MPLFGYIAKASRKKVQNLKPIFAHNNIRRV